MWQRRGKMIETDKVDLTLKLWSKERIECDASSKSILMRISLLSDAFTAQLTEALKPFGLTPIVYHILTQLRIRGPSFQMSPKEILEVMRLTSGGTSNILDRMERDRLIERRSDPKDGRALLIKLTQKGKGLVEKAMSAQAQIESLVTKELAESERQVMTKLLKKLSINFL
jgi:DNA-binding MarR family transcriptional regulator